MPRPRPGITLTEILIAIMILGVGLISLATLFPLGLLRLRDATRFTRSALLLQTAASDISARGLFNGPSFQYADNLNYRFTALGYATPPWYLTQQSGQTYNPLTQDTPFYYGDYLVAQQKGPAVTVGAKSALTGPGLPFAYDPLWRYQTMSTANGTQGYYMGDTYEARFGSGLGFLRTDPTGGLPSAHGLQRITNFNRPYLLVKNVEIPVQPMSLFVPNIFVSQEDLLWQDPQNTNYTINGQATTNYANTVAGPSPVLPDLNTGGGTATLDWRYSWMFTGQLTNSTNASCYDGNIVIFENRPFGIQVPPNVPFTQNLPANTGYQVEGETVVEAIFGYSNTVVTAPGFSGGYGAAADRTVLLRWSDQVPDPVVRVGDWIADVTYERQQLVIYNGQTGSGRFLNLVGNAPAGYPNPTNNFEWDNLPAQRCFWYQVQKVGDVTPDAVFSGHRSMVVYVNQSLVARTVLTKGPNGPLPVFLNAALIAPNVVNVIPQTIFVRSSTLNNQSPFGTLP